LALATASSPALKVSGSFKKPLLDSLSTALESALRFLPISNRRQLIIVGGMLLLYVFMAVSATTNKPTTFDEIQHLTLGYLYWTQPSNHLAPDKGIFAQAWAALPLLADHLKAPQETGAQWSNLGHWGEYYRFFYAMGNDPSAMLFQARTMISLLGATLGALIFFWSRELFGAWGGLVSLLLFIFCPNMLANGALVTADMAATLGFFAATLQLAYDFPPSDFAFTQFFALEQHGHESVSPGDFECG
jgi:hypothetical protein